MRSAAACCASSPSNSCTPMSPHRGWLAVLDEPTNHLDLPAIERLELALREFPGALLLVTHDERLGAAVTTRRIAL